MRRLITRLSRSAWLRRAVQVLRLHKLGNAWLRTFPMVKKLPGSGVVYRATRLESIPLAVEMFEKGNLYDAALLPKNFTTFADLGCNVGYFTCWLAHLAAAPGAPVSDPAWVEPVPERAGSETGAPPTCGGSMSAPGRAGRKLRGLMLDANPDAVKEAQWHAQANALPEVFGLHGIAGEGKPGDFAEFYLYESNICSTSHLPDVEKMALKGKWEKIRVLCVSIEDQWRRHFGDARCLC